MAQTERILVKNGIEVLYEIIVEKVGKNTTKSYRADMQDLMYKFIQFAHFSQFSDVTRETTKIPSRTDVRLDSSPAFNLGEITYGVDVDGNLTWLGEIVDSSD